MKWWHAKLLIGLQAAVILGLIGWLALRPARLLPASPDSADAGPGERAAIPDSDGPGGKGKEAPEAAEAGVVRLSAAMQQASGLRIARLEAAYAPPQGETWGEVLPAQGLADARLRLRQAALDVEQWDPALARARHESERLDALWQDGGNVARKLVDQAQAEQTQLESRQAAARSLQDALRGSLRSEWGPVLLEALERADGGVLAGVLSGSERLLLIGAPAGVRAEVTLAGHPESVIPVRRLAAAAQGLAGGTQPTWYWLAPAAPLRAGQRVRMSLGSRVAAAGVRVPESAVVWQAGQSWVYLVEDAQRFRRQAVILGGALPGGWFAGAPLLPGSPVVVQGAQLLLSEESRALIRNENGD